MMKGHQSHQKIPNNCRQEEPMFIRALQGHSGNNLEILMLSHSQIEKGYVPFLYDIGFSRYEDPIKSGGLVPEGFGTSKGRNAWYF